MTFSFEITIFKELIQKYPTWDQLQQFLESEEGGLFRIIDKDDKEFCLIRYEKGSSNMTLPHSKWFRSVVWNTISNRPVCVAPCKTSSEEFPYHTLKQLKLAEILCQENLEGFMINCFQMIHDTKLHITSRSKLNAAGTFYSKKTFRELFVEAYEDTFEQKEKTRFDIMMKPNEENEEVSVYYSFLVQHVEHKIVKNNTENKVYIIQKGTIYNDGRIMVEDGDLESIPIPTLPSTVPSYANIVANQVSLEVQEWLKKVVSEKPHDFQGIVLKDRQGNRWRVRSEKYSAIRSLRGNSPSIRDRFCQLYTTNLIHKYLEYYPEDSWTVSVLLTQTNKVIKLLYDLYVELHIHKTKKVEDIDKMFHPHLYSLHGVYLSQLRPSGKVMTQQAVQLYLHKQPWQRLSFLIRKQVDIQDIVSLVRHELDG
jgi:hypothetical protein